MTPITFQGEAIRQMPYVTHGECDGCVFQDNDVDASKPCPHTEKIVLCDVDSPIWIYDTPEAIAAYVARRME